ncbi:hypothetical protein SAMN05519105_0630 [Rhodobacter sp. 24-YEA-8]|nr:hypothetical protein SAMN05519105_0630 [Rhodobacter sp. 24-YEA-8]
MRCPGGTALDHQVGFDRHGKAQHQRRRHRQGEKAEKAAMAARGAGEAGTGEAHRENLSCILAADLAGRAETCPMTKTVILR